MDVSYPVVMIRKATVNDIPAVAAIYDEIHSEEEKGRLEVGWERNVYPTEQMQATSPLILQRS